MLRIGIVAGEKSGDLIAADLIRALKSQFPGVVIEGIAGTEMRKAGCRAIFDCEKLAVMGFTEVIKRLPELLSIRRQILHYFIENPPDIFIGVDAPDFNLALERKLKKHAIKTVHYVSPSVWAWRQYRVKKIAKSVDKMLTLFPFEATFYQQHQVPVKYVGHPLADQIPLQCDTAAAREILAVPQGKRVIGLLPGSRFSEVSQLLELMLACADHVSQTEKNVFFIIPAATPQLKTYIEERVANRQNNISLKILDGQARVIMQAADVLLLASGTAALEAMLYKKPMIVTYKLSAISYWISKKLAAVSKVSLPNHLDKSEPVPEYLQDQATVGMVGPALLELFTNREEQRDMCKNFLLYHQQLKCNASEQAAIEIKNMLNSVISFPLEKNQ